MKRINENTGKPFKKGDNRPTSDIQDGKKFYAYHKDRKTTKGYYVENWFDPSSLDNAKKRVNPATGKPFKKGDILDGKIFKAYRDKVSSDGFRYEQWLKVPDIKNASKKLNPETGKLWKRGDLRSDGFIFTHHSSQEVDSKGFFRLYFQNPALQRKDKNKQGMAINE